MLFIPIRSFVFPLVVAAAAFVPPVVEQAAAQTTTASHKHYDDSKPAPPVAPGAPLAPRLQNLGVHTFPVSTKDARAQLFMNQGLNLTFGFNHAEAARAFAEAARLDPSLAMAYWGQALVLGPNINAAMDPAAESKARELIDKAIALKSHAAPRERAYIDALAARYTGNPADRARADRAYADAMRDVVDRFPDDLDARTLYAEALMDLRPWGYWTRDGRPYDETLKIESALQSVLGRHENHPGALHLWIHLFEAVDPKRAEAEADRLVPLMPGAGHIVHMPAHIYQRVGRHQDVIRVNQLAAKADEDYIAQCRAQGVYPLGYYPHNLHFIWMGASANGQQTLAIESARKLAAAIPQEAIVAAPALQGFRVVPYYALVRFSQWEAILAEPAPAYDAPFSRSIWRYARALALLNRDRVDEAERELAEIRTLSADPSLQGQTTFSMNSGAAVVQIAVEIVAGEIALKRGAIDRAIAHFDRAVRYEDALVYQEPPDWHVPARQNLAIALLIAHRAPEAETVLWEDLKRNPEHGWNLALLSKALKTQGKVADAAGIDARFAKSWKGADAALVTSLRESVMVHFTAAGTVPSISFADARLRNGVRLHYAQQGPSTAPAILLLHGYSDSWLSFSRVMPLMPAHCRMIAIDARGHGDSERPAGGYRIEHMAEDVLLLMDALKIPSATIVGHSMGSFVAQAVADLAPARVAGMVLMGSAPLFANANIRELAAAVEELQDPVDRDFVREFQYSTVFAAVPDAFMLKAIANSERMPARVWKELARGFLDYRAAPVRPRVRTLVIGGRKDAVFSVAEHIELARQLDAALELFDGIGHALHWEDPSAFAQALRTFVA